MLGRVVSHSGGYPGFGSNMRWHPATGLAVIALGNGTYAPMTGVAELVLRALVPRSAAYHLDLAPAPAGQIPLLSVGALNPNGSKALFSDDAGWVNSWGPGAMVISTFPLTFHSRYSPPLNEDSVSVSSTAPVVAALSWIRSSRPMLGQSTA